MRAVDEARLVDTIYDAANGAAAWSTMLARVSDAVSGGPINHTDLDIVSGEGFGSATRADHDVMNRYFADWSTINPLLLVDDPAAFRAGWRLRILQDDEITERESLIHTPYYNEFLKPIEAPHSIIIRLALRDTVVTTMAIGRSSRRGRFDACEMALAARLQPHLVRADRIRRQLALADARLAQLHSVLDHTDQPLLFVDGFGRVQACSAAAAALLAECGPLRLGSGERLQADAAADAAALRDLLAAAWTGTELGGPDTIELGTGHGMRLRITINRVRTHDLPTLGSDLLMLVSLQRVSRRSDVVRRLQAVFGLTPAEANVALGLLAGDSLRTIADRHGCTLNTVRTQLAAVFAKTRCHRQAELVRMLIAAGFAPAD